MTFLGKLFVMFNVALSLLMAFLAFGLYATGVEWGYDPAKPGQAGGILKEKQDKLKEFQGNQGSVETTWAIVQSNLWTTEEARLKDRVFYAAEFDHLRTKADEANPARVVQIDDKTFRPIREPNGLPKMETTKERGDKDKAKDLQSRLVYDRDLKKAEADNLAVLADLDKRIKETIALTNLMIDDPARNLPDAMDDPKGPRGLRSLLGLERVKREGVEEEQRQVNPLFVNTAIEGDLVLKRLESLKERIAELKAHMSKRGMDVKVSRR